MSTNVSSPTADTPRAENSARVLHALENNLLEELRQSYARDGTIGDDLLESLYFLYNEPLFDALNQIDRMEQQLYETKPAGEQATASDNNNADLDKSLVLCVRCPSGRRVYQTKGFGSSDINHYILFEDLLFCSCARYKYDVLGGGGGGVSFVACKHQILVKLLRAMNKIGAKSVSDPEMATLIKQMQ